MAITRNGSQPAAADVTTNGTATFTNKTINLSNNTVSGTIAQFNTAVSDADLATLAGSETLTNKTLTSPVVSGLTLSDGSFVLEGATANDFETTIQVTDPTADRTITFQDATGTVVLRDSTDTLTNKTLTSPTVGTQASFDNRAEARFLEATANGTNYVGFKAPASITTNLVWTLPSADGTANQSLVTDGSGTLSFAASSSGVSANDQAFAFAVQVFA